jgi:Domain of unknown function (DUF4129)
MEDILAAAMQAVRIRTGSVVLALTMLISVVAIAGREPLHGTVAPSRGTERQPAHATPTPAPQLQAPDAQPPDKRTRRSGQDSGDAQWLQWALAAIALIGLLAAGVLLARELSAWDTRRRRSRAAAPEPVASQPAAEGAEEDAALASRAVDAALAPLRESSDPRSGVIEAYARMELVLNERQLGRRPSEAPREYLARVLRNHGAPERSLATLTSLFEKARFSRHPVSEAERRSALGALEQARAALDQS